MDTKQEITPKKFDIGLQSINRIEFFFEQLISYYQTDSTRLLEFLSVFEISKLFIKLRKYAESPERLFISQEASEIHDNEEDQKKVKHIEKLFF